MKTDELVGLLATGVQPIPAGAARQRLLRGLLASVPLTIALMLALLGVRSDIAAASQQGMFWVKLALPVLLLAAGLHAVSGLSRPGRRAPAALPLVAADVGMIWLLAALALLAAAPGERLALLLGESWWQCPLLILMLSVPSFIAGLWMMKGLAPTRPAAAGAAAGLLAGGVGATVYCFHCAEMAAPFLATWYVLGMSLPVVLGALLGPRLLRW